MKYLVEFKEKIITTRITQCEIEAENEKEIKEKVKMGDYEVINEWDNNSEPEFLGVLGCWEDKLTPEFLELMTELIQNVNEDEN